MSGAAPGELFLASQSPRRRELLGIMGYRFHTLNPDVPEEPAPGEAPLDYVMRVAQAKARAGLELVADVPGAIVLAADTEVVLDGAVFGKPADAADAVAMLQRLSGRTHQVISVLWLVTAVRAESAHCLSQVGFAELERARIDEYVASGEPFGRAGAYAIQGRGGALVTHLAGSHSAVMGLPLHETDRLLRRFGLRPVPAA